MPLTPPFATRWRLAKVRRWSYRNPIAWLRFRHSTILGGTRMARIVLATFGSFGDLHPYIAVALELQRRGHTPVVATSPAYRAKVESLGLEFAPVRPDLPDPSEYGPFLKRMMHPSKGTQRLMTEFFLPQLANSFADTLAAANGADLLIGHPITFTVRLVAESRGIPWISSVLAPISFLSAYDPPAVPVIPGLAEWRFLGPWFFRGFFDFAKRATHAWGAPWHALRAELGLPPIRENPLFDAQHSPHRVLAMFSQHYAAPQVDWPTQTHVTGFPWYDRNANDALPDDVRDFLDAGDPPLVFTLGTAAVFDAGSFYVHAMEAARRLKRRAILMIGTDERNRPTQLPDSIRVVEYAPYSQLFPRAAAVIHQGGIGTTAQAMRAGVPMLVVPFAHDQHDNAARIRRLGVGGKLKRSRWSPRAAVAALQPLLHDPAIAQRANELGHRIHEESGAAIAADRIEADWQEFSRG
ncbi:glycosyltransferase [Tuwongella immobilis]|uniref:Uncharacterized protein n=1 Tax=Tuwongella immobilis TaxID=692036 RepID=A0A6C2YSY5_9BACT|nr:nucleotide disphospho-sugar-binding domain-containing protein [Tuwongella immobilis]VIP04491.1 glycosyl transferase : Glycosyl transferase family 28 OS=Phaeospirillum molischianum DSM 120 GN=PHAMO_20074 PE=4 SV=1: Glyco_transf_28: UDPGT [Tuwongella immobilis]VTS06344.1 glycosyl transferase : Glycosyl transferase family 28 OS=Phaeospirillum molischianum DSM 120 GN=PHAMO_20074 PE=4 SV=1: Glyco_transf_28: UDPGT [Tuwongella immobilis]